MHTENNMGEKDGGRKTSACTSFQPDLRVDASSAASMASRRWRRGGTVDAHAIAQTLTYVVDGVAADAQTREGNHGH